MDRDDVIQMGVVAGGIMLGGLGLIILNNLGVIGAVGNLSAKARALIPG